MENVEKHFAVVVRARRKEIGLSQEAMAAKAGIHRTYASSIERAKVSISIEIVCKVVACLELSLSDFWGRVEAEAKRSETKRKRGR